MCNLKEKTSIVEWIKDWFDENGPDCNAVIGISGGKDSTIVATLCVEALGKDRVIGVLMPKGFQHDLDIAKEVVDYLGIKSYEINMDDAYTAIVSNLNFPISEQTRINLTPRLRMATLYAVAQSLNGRVANTSNASESLLGYSTHWGDDVGDFSPIGGLLCTEVIELGKTLNLPEHFVTKAPEDGLTGKTDAEVLGFTYEEFDKYFLDEIHGRIPPEQKYECIMDKSRFKRESVCIPTYPI